MKLTIQQNKNRNQSKINLIDAVKQIKKKLVSKGYCVKKEEPYFLECLARAILIETRMEEKIDIPDLTQIFILFMEIDKDDKK